MEAFAICDTIRVALEQAIQTAKTFVSARYVALTNEHVSILMQLTRTIADVGVIFQCSSILIYTLKINYT